MIKQAAALVMTVGLAGSVGCAADVEQEEPFTTRAFEQGLTCDTQSGVHPMKAALAVAMAKEVGRLDPVHDLHVVDGLVALTNEALARCSQRGMNDCPNTSALLGMQGWTVNWYIPQNEFNAANFRSDLIASFDRQRSHEYNLMLNHPSRAPGEHGLTFRSITDHGACGVHYDFDATHDVNNIVERLVFFGGNNNPFIDFRSSGNVVSIDPTPTMNGDGSTSSNACTLGCFAYDTSLRDTCCSCDGHQGSFKRSPWDRKMLYCAY